TLFDPRDSDARVITEAIFTFQHNNHIRGENGLASLDKVMIPDIIMLRTRPIFYKILVTSALSHFVIEGTYPKETTMVSRCVVVSPSQHLREGIESLTYQRIALQHFCFQRSCQIVVKEVSGLDGGIDY
ncbi:hypothetical protein Moror_9520, partial [Moniliophthora roreri MCA 2997]